jgi:hypothetical protein
LPRPLQRHYPHGRSLGFESATGAARIDASIRGRPAEEETTSPLYSGGASGDGGDGGEEEETKSSPSAGSWRAGHLSQQPLRQSMGCSGAQRRSMSTSDVSNRPVQRVYPHGRHLGFSTIHLG